MKKEICSRSLQIVMLIFLCLIYFHSDAQQITFMEYFFDTDPGNGNATPVLISSPADSISLNTVINTSGLQAGKHVLFVRTKLSNGSWSLYEPKPFFIKQSIVAAEYFFDVDPGAGNASALAVTPGVDSTVINTSVSTSGLAAGNHVVFIRTKDDSGNWSLYEAREFFIKEPVLMAEYFFDTDPGIGNATSLPVTPGVDSTLIISGISTSGLSSGNHTLFVRTKDVAGHWSFYETREFYIKQPIVSAECFFDTDPGIGNGISLPVTPGVDSTTITTSVSTSGLLSGNHVLFIRTKDAGGHWSMYEPREFNIEKAIVAAEYFIDADPGVGSGIPLTISSPGNTININLPITTAFLPSGSHFLFVRSKDDKGIWSLYEAQEFVVGNPLPVEWLRFDAVRKADNAILTWSTATEVNCHKYEVERMIPDGPFGQVFTKIGEVSGNGNSTISHEYNFTDEHVIYSGNVYYRVKQIDFDGNISYSEVASIKFSELKSLVNIYPNPSRSIFNCDLTFNDESAMEIEIINSNGQLIKTFNHMSFPFRFGDDLSPGTFLLRVKNRKEILTYKIIKSE